MSEKAAICLGRHLDARVANRDETKLVTEMKTETERKMKTKLMLSDVVVFAASANINKPIDVLLTHQGSSSYSLRFCIDRAKSPLGAHMRVPCPEFRVLGCLGVRWAHIYPGRRWS